MEIIIKDDTGIIKLSNDELDNGNFVDMYVEDDNLKKASVTVSIDELLAAIQAFQNLRIERKKWDNLMFKGK